MSRQKPQSDALTARLLGAKTYTGTDIFLYETHKENHLRSRLHLVSFHIARVLEQSDLGADEILIDALERLRRAVDDPIHYGGRGPGSHFDDSANTPTVPDPYFNYGELLDCGATGAEGFEGFKRAVGLDSRIDFQTARALIILLLIDSAVQHLNNGDYLLAGSEGIEATELAERLFFDLGYEARHAEYRREFARMGALASRRETEEYKRAVLAEWKTGRFDNNKSAAARWARKQFPIKHDETVRRWIREYEKKRTTTEQGE